MWGCFVPSLQIPLLSISFLLVFCFVRSGILHIKIKDMVHGKRYGSMDLLLELVPELHLELLLVVLLLYVSSRARVTVPCTQSVLPKIVADFNQSAFLLKKY